MSAHFPTDSVIRRVNIEPAFEAWQRLGGARSLVVYEAVGVPGMLDDVLRDCPAGTGVLVVGVCMEQDRINPFFGIAKELNIQFALGYDPMEFAGTLHSIAEGELDVAPLLDDAELLKDGAGLAGQVFGDVVDRGDEAAMIDVLLAGLAFLGLADGHQGAEQGDPLAGGEAGVADDPLLLD